MRENRTSGSEGGEAQTNELSLPLSLRTRSTFQGLGSLRVGPQGPDITINNHNRQMLRHSNVGTLELWNVVR